ncbi:DegT/DnrJ/EryC1/StrS family aminotransferase [Candidatus Nitrosotenuis sp. DW1]|uniref:DegT/DnrJ/EryC1/StrS family aminotransferase n=1 Tax=Candidatus Nitrosotenuis sp. DW1 TaxID=2259672 RepID=UPI0015CB4159|nr:DegT/DnrJ/EryC1/StrS family aminotransferase [Candidatus Nitrosotenuis sp. DW1]
MKVLSLTARDAFNDNTIKVPFFSQDITNEDKKAVISALASPLLTDGPILRKFENDFRVFTGSKYTVGVSNATAALHLSLKALGIGKNDEVLIPDMTFVATASAVLLTGATPVLVDVNDDDLNISVKSIENSLTSKTKAVIPVHFAGRACNMKKIMEIARKNNLRVIEDCAHAIGAKYDGKHVGTFGDAGCFSFYPTKNITTIEGGMVITKSKTIADHIRTARNHGITKSLTQRYSHGRPWDYDVTEPGYNYRLDEIRAALGISQLKRINILNQMRSKACEYYNSKLKTVKGIKIPISDKADAYHLYVIRIKNEYGVKRDQLFEKLLKNGIRTSVHYKPLHEFTVFKKRAKIYDKLDNSKQAYKEIISLPLYTRISRDIQDKVIAAIAKQ